MKEAMRQKKRRDVAKACLKAHPEIAKNWMEGIE